MPRSTAPFRPAPFLFAAVLMSATIAQSALALPHTASKAVTVGSVRVRVSDLDLRNDTDVQALLGRLERAAVTACGGNPRLHRDYDAMPRYVTEVFHQCRHDAIARAVATIGVPKVALAFEEASRRAATAERPHLTHSGDAARETGT